MFDLNMSNCIAESYMKKVDYPKVWYYFTLARLCNISAERVPFFRPVIHQKVAKFNISSAGKSTRHKQI